MYRQFDGYPSGMGMDLSTFLNQFTLVNGIGLNEKRKIANGVSCLAALIVSHFKGDAPGGIYLHAGSDKDKPGDYGEEYIYNVWGNDGIGIYFSCYYVYDKRELFSGTPNEFIEKYSKELAE